MALHIELEPESERKLGSEALRRHIPIEQYARQRLEASLASKPNSSSLTADEEEQLLDELAGIGKNIPAPKNDYSYSRETIYAEHD